MPLASARQLLRNPKARFHIHTGSITNENPLPEVHLGRRLWVNY